MSYRQFKPHSSLSPYIDAYWKVTGEGTKPLLTRILPDCCIDIIVNLGENFVADGDGYIMKNEKVYLVGTMTRYKDTIRDPETHLLGVRFKPAAFDHFYKKYPPLHELADSIAEFEDEHIPPIDKLNHDFISAFNNYFLKRLCPTNFSIFTIIDEINNRKGKISVSELAKCHYTTARQLQRLFREHMGIGPKDFINFVRYRFALQTIQERQRTRSLLDIAFDSGYYDHAHLTNEIKKYAGINPSEL